MAERVRTWTSVLLDRMHVMCGQHAPTRLEVSNVNAGAGSSEVGSLAPMSTNVVAALTTATPTPRVRTGTALSGVRVTAVFPAMVPRCVRISTSVLRPKSLPGCALRKRPVATRLDRLHASVGVDLLEVAKNVVSCRNVLMAATTVRGTATARK